jgi:putative oxidoreductase
MKADVDAIFHPIQNYVLLIARALLSALFIWSGINKILDPAGTQQYMAAYGMPWTSVFLVAAIVTELGGGLSVLLGYRSRLGAAVLALFLIPATLIFHTNFADPIQQIMFMKNLAIFGGLLMIVQIGSGQIALQKD